MLPAAPSTGPLGAVESAAARLSEARRRARRHGVRLLAAGVAFYGFLALFPALGAGLSLFGLMAEAPPSAAETLPSAPSPVRDSLNHYGRQLARQPRGHLGAGLILGVMVALWSASRGAGALMKALNETYDVRETRGYLRAKATALVITLAAILAVVVAAALTAAIPRLLADLGLGPPVVRLIGQLRWPTMVLLVTAILGAIYRYGPCHPARRPPWLSAGALVAALVWDIGSGLLSLYFGYLSHLDRTYGSVAATVALMLWLYVAAIAVLFGAEVNAGARAA